MLTLRNDPAGAGTWGAIRTRRDGTTYAHKGMDIAGRPGDIIVAPWTMRIERTSYPYRDDLSYSGIKWSSDRMTGRIWYLLPKRALVGTRVTKGDPIGLLQDVTQRYPDSGMTPHWHLQIDSLDPMVIIDLMSTLDRLRGGIL